MAVDPGTQSPREAGQRKDDTQASFATRREGDLSPAGSTTGLPGLGGVAAQGADHTNGEAPLSVEAALRQSIALPVFKAGDTVSIFRLLIFRYPMVEGRAEIVAPIPGHAHEYVVRFPGDARLRRRFVLPGDFQRAPEATLEALRAVWRAGIDPAIAEEFFADLEAANDNEEDA